MIQFDNCVKRFGELILDELKEAKINCWIAGGSLRDYFSGVPHKTDYDIFFPNEEEYKKADFYLKQNNANIKWESDNGMKLEYKDKTFDLVKFFYPNPQQTIEAFDFTVSMFAVDTEKVYFGESSFIDLSKRQLMINKITYPASTLSRSFRYHKKGFSMCMGEMKKLFEAIQDTPKIEPKETENEEEEITSGDLFGFFTGID